ncbi:MAG TPA: helix-turn-helix domain-containing protein [Thermoanaerobaculia bacterium]|nr:helix-turn-helix domain-containing protein [Thermoanaerobaculia bacterium]
MPARSEPGSLRGLRLPRQARSRATLDRLMTAAAELLAERRFEEATVAELVKRAGSSVGAFYARFGNKEALLRELDERLFEAGRTSWRDFLADERWERAGAGEILDAFVGRLVAKRRERRGLLRALVLHARANPGSDFAKRSVRLNRRLVGRITEMLLARRGDMGHPRPEEAVPFALQIADSVTRDAIVFEEGALAPKRSDRALEADLTRVIRLHLGVKEP